MKGRRGGADSKQEQAEGFILGRFLAEPFRRAAADVDNLGVVEKWGNGR